VALSAQHGGNLSPWPAVEWEQQQWHHHLIGGLTRRERQAQGRQSYRSSIPATIAHRQVIVGGETLADLDEATARVAGFESDSRRLPAPLLGVLLRSESASSSQIEHITASARAVAEAQVTGQGSGNAALVAANVHAMTQALAGTEPITPERIESIQRTLMRDRLQLAGWRQEPVWIGGADSSPVDADFVPPDHRRIPGAIADLTEFIARDDLPVLAQAAIAHAQFETIHPFADGNGRTGRALVHLILQQKQLATSATVPVSGGLLADKANYFDALTAYREGDAGPIISVFSRAALHAVANGERLATRVAAVQNNWRERIVARADSSVWKVIDVLPEHPVADAEGLARAIGGDSRNIHRQLRLLTETGVLIQSKHYKSRRMLFRAPDLLHALDEYARGFGRRAG